MFRLLATSSLLASAVLATPAKAPRQFSEDGYSFNTVTASTLTIGSSYTFSWIAPEGATGQLQLIIDALGTIPYGYVTGYTWSGEEETIAEYYTGSIYIGNVDVTDSSYTWVVESTTADQNSSIVLDGTTNNYYIQAAQEPDYEFLFESNAFNVVAA